MRKHKEILTVVMFFLFVTLNGTAIVSSLETGRQLTSGTSINEEEIFLHQPLSNNRSVFVTSSDDKETLFSVLQDSIDEGFFVNVSEITFSAKGEEKIVRLTSDVPWKATSAQNWISISPSSGTGDAVISIRADKNVAGERIAVLAINSSRKEPLKVSITQEEPATRILFPGSDFEDWSVFLENIYPYFPKIIKQSEKGVGVDGGCALHVLGIDDYEKSTRSIFNAIASGDSPLDGKSKISFYIKGTTAEASLVVRLYYKEGNNSYCYNLGTIATKDMIIEPTVGKTATSDGIPDFSGSIDTRNQWVKVSLDVSPNKLKYGYRKVVGLAMIAVEFLGNTDFDLLIDNFVVE